MARVFGLIPGTLFVWFSVCREFGPINLIAGKIKKAPPGGEAFHADDRGNPAEAQMYSGNLVFWTY